MSEVIHHEFIQKRVPCSSLLPGQYFIDLERMDDGAGNIEIRLTLFRKEEGTAVVNLPPDRRYMKIRRYGLIQGNPLSAPRYISLSDVGTEGVMPPQHQVIPTTLTSLRGITLPPDHKKQKQRPPS